MSRHRNVRSMNYSDEYDGYDDVYGHSVEDEYCVSPSEAAFMYDREGSKNKQKIGAFFQTVTDIAEENEADSEMREANLSDIDKARLESCIDQIKQIVGGSVPRQDLVNIVLLYNFNAEKAVNFILGCPQYKDVTASDRKEKDDTLYKKSPKNFTIPKLNGFATKLPMTFKRVALKTDSSNFSSLNELSKNHLESLQTKVFKIDFSKKPNFGKKVNSLADDVDRLNLSIKSEVDSIKSESGVTDTLSNYHVDLTKALRGVNSSPQLRTLQIESELFTPEFIDCEIIANSVQAAPSVCKMNLTLGKNITFKRVSKFGKVLCLSYRRPKIHLNHDLNKFNCNGVVQFMFDCPSPDDMRLSMLHRHLKLEKH